MQSLGGPVRTTSVRTVIATAGLMLACGSLTACGQRYDDRADDCLYAFRERADGETAKPKACDAMKDDDYAALVREVTAENEVVEKLLRDLEDADN